ncbi:MAG: hypothetical protein RIR79_2325, partial [Pseudomonadota bacterium]
MIITMMNMSKISRFFQIFFTIFLGLLIAASGFSAWYWYVRLPQREGEIRLPQLSALVTIAYDERGVPHIQAQNEIDAYRALGYVHAQDRLFQMEMARRLARGELSEILGDKLLATDKLFRTLGINERAIAMAAQLDSQQPATQALLAYLDGVNHYQATHPAPLEFGILGIPQRPFTSQDTFAVTGYLAYSFGMAFRTDPLFSTIRDKLGAEYLEIFDSRSNEVAHPLSLLSQKSTSTSDIPSISNISNISNISSIPHFFDIADIADIANMVGLPMMEGSNAWVVSGQRSASGKPLLAGDPHIAFSTPAIWYEAHISTPDYQLYGHYQPLNPMALLGHNSEFGWSLTMFEND